jgi:hypothetical protein
VKAPHTQNSFTEVAIALAECSASKNLKQGKRLRCEREGGWKG